MITSKQRAYLRKLAHDIDPIFQIGKGGVSDEMLHQLSNALEAREIIKIHVLESAGRDTKELCNEVAKELHAEPVQAIGSKFVLYRAPKPTKKDKKIQLPGV
jgi:RNA-binding protein